VDRREHAMSDKFREAFREEAAELLGELETSLLELEENPGEKDLVDRVFRAMHTIKGTGAMFGFDAVSSFTHEVETVFDLVRKGELGISRDLIDLTLAARDFIRGMLDPSGGEADPATRESLLSRYRALSRGGKPAAGQAAAVPAAPAAADAAGLVTYRIRFRPAADIFLHGTNPVLLLDELRGLGRARVLAHMEGIPALDAIQPEQCSLFWDVILTTDKGINAVKDVFIFVQDDSELRIEQLSDQHAPETEAELKKLGEILIERGDITAADLETALGEKKRVGEILVEAGLVSKDEVRSALAEQEHLKEVRDRQKQEDSSASIRVRADKLDGLMDLVGELVTLQARLGQTAGSRQDPELALIAEQAERLTGSLRDISMSMRLLPIATSFGRFRRVVRDLSGELGKEVDLATEGGDTELDKTVIERLTDPLVHLIRNSVDHGVEMPAERERAGKPRKGTVRLSAEHSGSHVLIRVADDGAGMDRETIRAKGIERGLIPADAELSERAIFELIFMPGFSTAKRVTSVSGRGVGMDVVKRSIDSLGGTVEIQSAPGTGSTITLKIPLTLAIIEGLLVRIAEGYYVLPLQAVEECVELSRAEREAGEKTRGRTMANVRGEIVPYIRLREWFNTGGESPELEQVVISRADGRRIGFVVDAVVGQHQTVIKSLGKLYRNVEGISGATILGDGTVALILDIFAVIGQVERERDARRA
jgi:two-component system, chemotaxis family, sensor kinase CheA